MSDDNRDPNIQKVSLNDIRPGPIRHESLAPEQLEQLRIIYQALEPVLRTPFEQFELNFLRDLDPGSEIQIWSCIAASHQTFLKRHPDATFDEAEQAFKAFLMISMGAERPAEIEQSQWWSFEAIYEGR